RRGGGVRRGGGRLAPIPASKAGATARPNKQTGGQIMRKEIFGASILALGLLAGGQAQSVDIGFATHTSTPGPEFEAVDKFIELVTERSNGEITVRTYPSAVLGGERDNIEQLTVNEVQMTLNGDLLPNVIAPEYAATVVPFVFPNPEAVYEYWA